MPGGQAPYSVTAAVFFHLSSKRGIVLDAACHLVQLVVAELLYLGEVPLELCGRYAIAQLSGRLLEELAVTLRLSRPGDALHRGIKLLAELLGRGQVRFQSFHLGGLVRYSHPPPRTDKRSCPLFL